MTILVLSFCATLPKNRTKNILLKKVANFLQKTKKYGTMIALEGYPSG